MSTCETPTNREGLSPYPESEAHERHFGNNIYAKLPLDSLIILSQVRDGENPCFEEIQRSIDETDLDNPINVGRLTYEQLETYVDFTNATWGTDAKASDLVDYRQPDGHYNLVVAGHTRTLGMFSIAQAHTAATGQPTAYTVECKLEEDTSVDGIVATQLKENLHARPRMERGAMAVVELYASGRGTKWQTPTEFRKQQEGRFSRRMVDNAIAFAELEPDLRSLVFGWHLPYTAGVGLGKAARVVRSYFALEAGIQDATTDEDITAATNDYLRAAAAHIRSRKLNSTAADAYIGAFVQTMRSRIKTQRESTENIEVNEPVQLVMVGPTQVAAAIRRREKDNLARALRELNTMTLTRAAEMLINLSMASDPDAKEEGMQRTLQDAAQATELFQREIARRYGVNALKLANRNQQV